MSNLKIHGWFCSHCVKSNDSNQSTLL